MMLSRTQESEQSRSGKQCIRRIKFFIHLFEALYGQLHLLIINFLPPVAARLYRVVALSTLRACDLRLPVTLVTTCIGPFPSRRQDGREHSNRSLMAPPFQVLCNLEMIIRIPYHQ